MVTFPTRKVLTQKGLLLTRRAFWSKKGPSFDHKSLIYLEGFYGQKKAFFAQNLLEGFYGQKKALFDQTFLIKKGLLLTIKAFQNIWKIRLLWSKEGNFWTISQNTQLANRDFGMWTMWKIFYWTLHFKRRI